MRSLLRLVLGLLLAASGSLALGYALTPYASLLARVTGPSLGVEGGRVVLALTAARYATLRGGLAAVAVVAALLLAATALGRQAARRRPGSWPAGRALWAAATSPLRQLSGPQRLAAAGLGLAVGAARLYYAAAYPLSLDEVASYDFCVLPGPALTASYYPFPNNHLAANLLVGLVHGLLPTAPPALALRLLPTVLGLLVLPLAYAGLLRALRFGPATLGLGLYALSPLGVYYAVAGRGYAYTMPATLAGLLAAAALLRPGGLPAPGRRLAWVVFVTSAVAGLYAVPTHLYVMLLLGLGLLAGFAGQPRRQRAANLVRLVLALGGSALVVGVLYLPVGAVSGWGALLANPYVARHAWPELSRQLGPWLVGTASELLGQRGWSSLAYCGLALATPPVLGWGVLPPAARRLGWLLYGQLVGWLPLVALQGVYPPARTLLPALLAFFLLAALLGAAAGLALGGRPWRWVRGRAGAAGLAAVVLAYGGYRLRREQLVLQAHQREQASLRQAYGWLRRHPARRVWVAPRGFALYWEHYALAAGQAPLPLTVVSDVPAPVRPAAGEVEALAAEPPAGRPVLYQAGPVRLVPVAPPAWPVLDE